MTVPVRTIKYVEMRDLFREVSTNDEYLWRSQRVVLVLKDDMNEGNLGGESLHPKFAVMSAVECTLDTAEYCDDQHLKDLLDQLNKLPEEVDFVEII